eukprot:jgi/Mesvir1/26068/Mv06793-RA.1
MGSRNAGADGPSHYDVLDAPEDSSVDVLRRSYRAKVLELHPDRRAQDEQGSDDLNAGFHRVQLAWDVLCDPASRLAYDRQLRAKRNKEEAAYSLADHVELDDMSNYEVDGQVMHSHPCRCSGRFELPQEELGAAHLQAAAHEECMMAVPCDSCSLHLAVHFKGVPRLS